MLRKNLAHSKHAGNQSGESGALHVVFDATRKQLAEFGGIDVAQHRQVHSLGARRAQRIVGAVGAFAQVQAGGVDLEEGLVAGAGAIELQPRTAQVGHVVIAHTRGLGLRDGA